MSVVSEIEMTDPYGDTANVLKISIDSSNDVYLLQRTIKTTGDYTFSIWYRSASASKIIFNLFGTSETIDSTTKWQKYVKTVTVETLDNTSIYIQPSLNVDGYFYEGYLTEGIADTSWTPAPEDLYDEIGSVESEINQMADSIELKVTSTIQGTITDLTTDVDGIKAEITDANGSYTTLKERLEGIEITTSDAISESSTSITTNCEQIILEACKGYTETGDFDNFKETVSAQLEILADQIQMKFEAATDQTDELNDKLNQTNSDLAKYFDFSIDGLIIKSGEGQMQLHLDNDIVRFLKNGEQFGYWDGVNFHTGNIYVDVYERAQFGNFAYIPRSDGSLSFLKVDDYVMISISEQPVSVSTAAGNSATFSVTATGSGLKYQWQIKKITEDDFSDATDASATTSSFTRKAATYTSDNNMGVSVTYKVFEIRCKITDIKDKVMYTDTVTLTAT